MQIEQIKDYCQRFGLGFRLSTTSARPLIFVDKDNDTQYYMSEHDFFEKVFPEDMEPRAAAAAFEMVGAYDLTAGSESLNCEVFNKGTLQIVEGYEQLLEVLRGAYEQASGGKGAERHSAGNRLPFHKQRMQLIADANGYGFITGQVSKKLLEAKDLLILKGQGAASREVYGAVNYCAGALIYLMRCAEEGREP